MPCATLPSSLPGLVCLTVLCRSMATGTRAGCSRSPKTPAIYEGRCCLGSRWPAAERPTSGGAPMTRSRGSRTRVTPVAADSAEASGGDIGAGIGRAASGPFTVWLKGGSGPSHGHADLSSVAVAADGRWLTGDPGTGAYNGPLEERNAFRGSAFHNVLRVEDEDQLVPHRAFRWVHEEAGALGEPIRFDDTIVMWTVHDAYGRLTPPRRVARVVDRGCRDGVVVADHVEGRPGSDRALSPARPGGRLGRKQHRRWRSMDRGISPRPSRRSELRSWLGSRSPYAGWWSETYGSAAPSTLIQIRCDGVEPVVWAIRSSDEAERASARTGARGIATEVAVRRRNGAAPRRGRTVAPTSGVFDVTKRVLVLNHFAVPAEQAGGTRHTELFDRLDGEWSYALVGADRSLLTGERSHRSAGTYRAVRTTPYRGNGISRIMNWLSYAASATLFGMRQRQVDVVYASSPHLLAGLAGWIVARIRRAAFVLEIRDLWPRILVDMGRMRSTSPFYRLLRSLERFLYRQADEVVVLAQGSANTIRADCPEVARITFLPNGSDPAMFAVDEDRDALRQRYGMTGLAFVYAGAHGPANGLGLVLDAAEQLQRDLPEVEFVLVGDGAEKPQLVADASRRGLDNVRFLDPIPKSEMPQLLAAGDVGLHVLADVPLFRYGVSPNKLFDYMAAGLPVVTNCPGEVEETVNSAHAGIAVAPNEIDVAVRRFVAAPVEQRESWGRAGRDFIVEHRSREVIAGQLADVLERVVVRQ